MLHPHVCAPWVIHPFSVTPTLNFIEGPERGWWAPCIWCGFGVAALDGGACRIHTRLGAETEPIVIPVQDGQPAAFTDLFVHFAIPPTRAWDNVRQHCSMVLPFRSPEAIDAWRQSHALPRGEAVPLPQVADLAKRWYGRHADPDWRKWSIAEAQQIFHDTGLTSPFWDLGLTRGAKAGRF